MLTYKFGCIWNDKSIIDIGLYSEYILYIVPILRIYSLYRFNFIAIWTPDINEGSAIF